MATIERELREKFLKINYLHMYSSINEAPEEVIDLGYGKTESGSDF